MGLITVDLRDRKQLYEQIIDSVKNLILTGDLKQDDKLPSVRSLASELGINPNTIQKAYTELERTGVIVSMQGRGSIVYAGSGALRNEREERLVKKMTALASEMRIAGMTEEEFTSAALIAWKKSGGEEKNGGDNR